MKLNLPAGHWPPGGWQYFDPKTNYRENKPIERSELEVAEAMLGMRRNNRSKYPPEACTLEACIEELRLYTVRRLVNKGLKQFSMADQSPVPVMPQLKKKPHEQSQISHGASAAKPAVAGKGNWIDRAKRILGGVSALSDWVGEGQQPVAQEVADFRAGVCTACPLNQKTGMLGSVVASVAEAIKTQTGLKAGLELSTIHDANLHTCTACDCHLPLKVWVTLKTISEHLDPEVYVSLDPKCWIINELQT